jgi:hypothetical protein
MPNEKPQAADHVKAINKQTTVSVALVITMIGVSAYVVSNLSILNTRVDAHQTSPTSHDFVPRSEIDVRLGNIEESIMRIEKAVID